MGVEQNFCGIAFHWNMKLRSKIFHLKEEKNKMYVENL